MDTLKIDLRELGVFEKDSAIYLANLIAHVCQRDEAKKHLSLYTREYFEWDDDGLAMYFVAGVMTDFIYRVSNCLSSAEWLCSVFNSGQTLSEEHIHTIMIYINPNTSLQDSNECIYSSGKEVWYNAPELLKSVLDILDTAALNNQCVRVAYPEVIANVGLALEDLERMPLENVKDNCTIEWFD
jgi:hypothetical protein